MTVGLPRGSMVKNLPANAEDANLISESRRSPPGRGYGNSQHSYLGNPMERGAW